MRFVRKRKTVFVAMSGGVDSSVAALLLQQKGHEVIGVFMKNWSESIPGTLRCSTEDDERSARSVAAHLKIPFYVWDFESEYRALVFSPMVRAYAMGITPNPDVACNEHIKFGVFMEKALGLGADAMATGHYVRRTRNVFTGAYGLSKAKDTNKDQSYFLWTLTQEAIAKCLFPIGALRKPRVRAVARSAGLPSASRKDSQGLCFVGKLDFQTFLARHVPAQSGEIVLVTKDPRASAYQGRAIGMHQGLHAFTLGQRQGIGIGGGTPLYVVAKDMASRRLYVSDAETGKELFPRAVPLERVHAISGNVWEGNRAVGARYRYRQPLRPAVVRRTPQGSYEAVFREPAFGVTPGQSLVWYQGSALRGGAIIGQFSQEWLARLVI